MKFWFVILIVLLIVLDIIWMLDGFLNVQYGNLLNNNSSLNSTLTMAVNLFGDKPLVSLYYRIIITLIVIVFSILLSFMINRVSKYKSALTVSNYKYRSLFMEMKTGFALRKIIRDEEGKLKEIRFIEENPAFRMITGLNNDELKNRTVKDAFGDGNDELVREYDRIARYGGTFTKIHYSKKNDKILRITAYQHEEDVFATIVEDITKERQIEDRLKESAQLKDILLNTVSESVFYVDKEMKVIWANKKARDIAINNRDNVVGHKCSNVWCGSGKNSLECAALKAISTHKPELDEFKNLQGRSLRVHANPLFASDNEIKGVVVTVTDMTEWMNTIDNLKNKQAQLNLTLEVGKMTTWFWDAETDKVTLDHSSVINNGKRNSWMANNLHRYLHPEDKEEFIKQRELLKSGKLDEFKQEVRIGTRARGWTWFNVLGRVQEKDEKGIPKKMLGITYNIDNLKTANEELKQLKGELEDEVKVRLNELREKDLLMIRQSRQAAMGEMIGNIAHQWRQPLNSVAVIIQDMVDAWDFEELTREYLIEKVNLGMSILNHMSNTIDDFRDFFSPDKLPSEFRMDEQINKTINILKDMFNSQGIKIKADLQPVTIESYAREFSQVVINILNNAKDALMIHQTETPFIDVNLKEAGEEIVLTISDNAGGIPEDIIEKIFDPYFTTKHSSSGTGVGLYMSKNIIEKHLKGKLLAHNDENGAVFTIKLKAQKTA